MAFSPETFALLKGIANSAAASEEVATEAAEQAVAAAESAAASAGLAPLFDSSETYEEGDIVLYNGAVYRFTTDHTGAWDASDAEQITLADELAIKANIDGSYETMTVGNAEQLVSTIMAEDKTPYNFRTSGGSMDIGNRAFNKIVGADLLWRQLVTSGNKASGTMTPGGTNTYSYKSCGLGQAGLIPNHVYFVRAEVEYSGSRTDVQAFAEYQTGPSLRVYGGAFANGTSKIYGCFKRSNLGSDNQRLVIYIAGPSGGANLGSSDTWQYRRLVVFDLTVMLGAKAAEALVDKGDIVDSMLPFNYTADNSYSLKNVKTSGYKTVGFNAYNPATGTAVLVGGRKYQITGAYTTLSYADIYSETTTITPDEDGYFTPLRNGTLTVTGGDDSTTCVHLVWSGYRDGEWEAYNEHTYPLDNLDLHGVADADDEGNLCWDGDTYESNGTVTRNYTKTLLSGLTWGLDDGVFYASVTGAVSGRGRVLCALWPEAQGDEYGASLPDGTISLSGGVLYVKDSSIADLTAFATKISAFNAILQMTPTTESATPFTVPQIVDDFGTEEFVDSRTPAVPVGHVTHYMANLRDKTQHLPDLASEDGRYIISQTGEQMQLEDFPTVDDAPTEDSTNLVSSGGVYTAIQELLPPLPETDGTYVLKCSVADGEVVLSWDEEV